MYEELVKRLRNNRHPNGLKAQAADAIEKLAAEVERLHKENFWLSGRTDNA